MPDRPTILVPLRVLERESIPDGVPDLLANAHVVLLGYHVVPDQTATDQAKAQFEDTATRRLDEFTTLLDEAGATVESQLVFTHDGQTTIDRIIAEHDCLAVLIPNATRPIANLLVAVRGIVGIDRFIRLISGLFAAPESEEISSRIRSVFPGSEGQAPAVKITLYHVASENETDEDVETLLDGVATRLTEMGVPSEALDIQISRGDSPQEEIAAAAEDYDAVIMGESDPSVATILFGMTAENVAKQFLGPVFVVQRGEQEEVEDAEDE